MVAIQILLIIVAAVVIFYAVLALGIGAFVVAHVFGQC